MNVRSSGSGPIPTVVNAQICAQFSLASKADGTPPIVLRSPLTFSGLLPWHPATNPRHERTSTPTGEPSARVCLCVAFGRGQEDDSQCAPMASSEPLLMVRCAVFVVAHASPGERAVSVEMLPFPSLWLRGDVGTALRQSQDSIKSRALHCQSCAWCVRSTAHRGLHWERKGGHTCGRPSRTKASPVTFRGFISDTLQCQQLPFIAATACGVRFKQTLWPLHPEHLRTTFARAPPAFEVKAEEMNDVAHAPTRGERQEQKRRD